MKQLFERVSSYWVRYDKYEIRTDAKGTKYITAAADAKPDIFDPLADAQTMVLEALNVGRLYFGDDIPESKREAALLQFVHRYGLLGLMTALPTTPKFMQYEKVYLPKNHFIREEVLQTERYLDYFYPFKKLNIRKHKTEFIWEVEGDTDAMALAMTFANDPDAMSMSFQKEYAEPLDWIAKALKDMTFPFITSKYFYEHGDAFDADEKKLMALLSQYVEICILHAIIIRWEYYNYLWKELACMISKELKRLSRRELVDIIYQLKKNEQEKQDKIAALEDALQEKRIRVSVAGSIAEAAADITNVFSIAQTTADLYLHEIACMKEDTEQECARMLEEARKKVEKILADGKKQCNDLEARYQHDYQKWQQLQSEIQKLEQKNR